MVAFATEGTGRDIARLRDAIGGRRIDEAIAKAEAHVDRNTDRVSCDVRLVPRGSGEYHIEELAWVLADWKASSHTPEALRSIGTPWLLSHDIAAALVFSTHWPVPGVGHFLSAQRGDMVACVTPAPPLMERGCSMHEFVMLLCHSL